MKIKKVNCSDGNILIVDERFIKSIQEKGFFSVPNALELIENGERVYSDMNYFELVKEEDEKTKECFDRCPNCDSKNIIWGCKDWGGTSAWQTATCADCECEFEEIYEYKHTVYNLKR